MYLTGKNYTEPVSAPNTISVQKKTALKNKIRQFCPDDAKKSYEEIVIHIQETDNYTNDQIIDIIKEVADEDSYRPKATAEIEEVVPK